MWGGEDIVFSPDGRYVAVAACEGLLVLDSGTGNVVEKHVDVGACASSVDWSGDGKLIAVGRGDGVIELYGWENGKLEKLWRKRVGGTIYSRHLVRFNPTNPRLLAVGGGNGIYLLDVVEGRVLWSKSQYQSVSWDPRGRHVIAACRDELAVFDVDGGVVASRKDRCIGCSEYDRIYIVWLEENLVAAAVRGDCDLAIYEFDGSRLERVRNFYIGIHCPLLLPYNEAGVYAMSYTRHRGLLAIVTAHDVYVYKLFLRDIECGPALLFPESS